MSLTATIIDYLKGSGGLIAYSLTFAIVFIESGVLIGFFLPGDSLFLTLGFLASQGAFNIIILLILCSLGAILGDQVGYAFGYKVGPGLFSREDSRFFKKKNLQRAHEFYEKYGPRTIVLARFVPFARTFAPILAGMSKMNYKTFLRYNIIGGIAWVFLLVLLGYFLGHSIPNVDQYILYIVGAITLISIVPAYLEYRKHKKREQQAE